MPYPRLSALTIGVFWGGTQSSVTVQAETREGFGDERYEVSEFQAKVKTQFSALYTRLENVKPTVLDVSGMSIEAVGDKIEALVLGAIDSPPEPSTLW
eukprot:m.305276 g.305276  ORF g.305276 m.305276 type:complete len:98 (+) comp16340_c0_seq11:28-321(+)